MSTVPVSMGQNCLIQVALGLHPVTQLVEPFLGDGWRFVPAYFLFFLQIFAASGVLWRTVFKVDDKKTPILASAIMSSIHGILCVAAAIPELHGWSSFALDLPNTQLQSLQLQFSLAYLIADFLHVAAFDSKDRLSLAHHVLAGLYLVAVLHLRLGAISAIFVFFMGECTSPMLNIFTISKQLRHDKSWAARLFAYASPLFTVSFILVRSIISPPLIGWFLYSLLYNAPGIPIGWRVFMGALVTVGMAGSQLWSYKLIKGYSKAQAGNKGKKKKTT